MKSKPLIIPAAAMLALGAAPAAAQANVCGNDHAAGTVRLDISATAVRSAKGEVVFTLYPDDSSRFLAKGGKMARARVAARAGTTPSCFWVKPGYYAVTLYHDENGDGKFNRMLFIAREGVGASNDPSGSLGIPKFASVRFQVPAGGRAMPIRLRYPG